MRGPGKFEPREVKIGMSAEGMTQILEGVNAGEEVVSSSQFLIDSESKLREATAKMLDALQGSSSVAGAARKSGATEAMQPEPSVMDMNMSDHDMSGMGMDGMDMSDMGEAHGSASVTGGRTPGVTMGDDMNMNDMEMAE